MVVIRELIRVAAAMKGAIGDQKAVLVFPPDEHGDSLMYQGHATGDVEDIHAGLLGAGIENHILEPTEGGASVHIADLDGSLGGKVNDYAGSQGVALQALRGNAEFIGNEDPGGTDRDQRDRGPSAYTSVIEGSGFQTPEGRSAGSVWEGIRDRWATRIATLEAAFGRLGLAKAADDDDRVRETGDAKAQAADDAADGDEAGEEAGGRPSAGSTMCASMRPRQ